MNIIAQIHGRPQKIPPKKKCLRPNYICAQTQVVIRNRIESAFASNINKQLDLNKSCVI